MIRRADHVREVCACALVTIVGLSPLGPRGSTASGALAGRGVLTAPWSRPWTGPQLRWDLSKFSYLAVAPPNATRTGRHARFDDTLRGLLRGLRCECRGALCHGFRWQRLCGLAP